MTGNRTPTTINLDDDHREWMDEQNMNRSETVNEALTYYRESKGHVKNALIKHRQEELQQEAESLEERAEKKREQARELEETDAPSSGPAIDGRENIWRDAVTTITPPETTLKSSRRTNKDWSPSPDHDGVSFWADKLGISSREFCELYPEKRRELVE